MRKTVLFLMASLVILSISTDAYALGIGSQGGWFSCDEYVGGGVNINPWSATNEPYPVEIGLGTGIWVKSMFQTQDNEPEEVITSTIEGLDPEKFYITFCGRNNEDHSYYEPGYERSDEWISILECNGYIYPVWYIRPKPGYDWDDDPDHKFYMIGHVTAGINGAAWANEFCFEPREHVYNWPRGSDVIPFEQGSPSFVSSGEIRYDQRLFGGGQYLYAALPTIVDIPFKTGNISFDKHSSWLIIRFNISNDGLSYYELVINHNSKSNPDVDGLYLIVDGQRLALGAESSLEFSGGHFEIDRGEDGHIVIWRNGQIIIDVLDSTLMQAGPVLFMNAESGSLIGFDNIEICPVVDDATEIELEADSVELNEGQTDFLNVRLSGKPSIDAVLSISRTSGDNDIHIESIPQLTFTTTNWYVYQQIAFAADEDADTEDGSAVFTIHKVSGPNSLTDIDFTAYEIDNDAVIVMESLPAEGGSTNPAAGVLTVTKQVTVSIEAVPFANYAFINWTAEPSDAAVFTDADSLSTTVSIISDVNVTANFRPTAVLTIQSVPSEGGVTIPQAGSHTILENTETNINVEVTSGFGFTGWTASPIQNAIITNPQGLSTNIVLLDDAVITANFAPTAKFTIQANSSEGGTTVPSQGTSTVFLNQPVAIEAIPAANCGFLGWSASPPENVFIADPCSIISTVTLTGDANITANFNLPPLVQALASPAEIDISDSNSVILDASTSSDDGLPYQLGYSWQQISGANTCAIINPNEAITEVVFNEPDVYEFRITVNDGQLQGDLTVSVQVNPPQAPKIYVSSSGNDSTGLGTQEKPYRTIQRGVDQAIDSGEVVVMDGVYGGENNIPIKINRNINVHSMNGPGSCIVDCSGIARAFELSNNALLEGITIINGASSQGAGICANKAQIINCVISNCEGDGVYLGGNYYSVELKGCRITDNRAMGINCQANTIMKVSDCVVTGNALDGIYAQWSWSTLTNNVIVDNGRYGICIEMRSATITNNTVADNLCGIHYQQSSGSMNIQNSIVWSNRDGSFTGDSKTVEYSDIEGSFTGIGNIEQTPCFADPNRGDYHLCSEYGRWDPNTLQWVYDDITSPCIDSGKPDSDWIDEMWPHGKRINMGAYGGTVQASMSPSITGSIANIDNDVDNRVDFADFARLADKWQKKETLLHEDLNLDGQVDILDLMIFTDNWLWEIPGDFEPDGDVDFADFAYFASYWLKTNCGKCGGCDLTGDGNVDSYDLQEFAMRWLERL